MIRKFKAAIALLFAFTAIGAFAQTATFTTPTTNFDPAGGSATFDVSFDYTGQTLSTLGVNIALPTGWSYASASGSNVPPIVPDPGTTAAAEFAYFSIPANAISFSVTLNYGSALPGDQSIAGVVLYKVSGNSEELNAVLGPITISPPPTAPSFTQQPQSQSVDENGSASLAVQVEGNPTPTLQWNFNGSPISGATDSLYSLSVVTSSSAGDYTLTATNSVDAVTSDAATITVNTAPVITSDPSSATVNQGANISLSVTASGTAPLTYQWRKDTVDIAGAIAATLALTDVQPAAAGTYDVVVTNSVSDATSSGAVITVIEAPVVVSPPVGDTVVQGGTITFEANTSGTEPLSYQWIKDGQDIPGATDSSYSIATVLAEDAGDYSVRVSNAAGEVTTEAGTLVVQFKPVINVQPEDKTTGANGSVTFAVSASGNPEALTYQWLAIPSEGSTPTPVGTNSAELVLSNLQLSDNGTAYNVEITNTIGTTISESATLTVNQGPGFTLQPESATVTEGESALLSVAVTGNPTPTVQWQFSFEPLDSGDNILAITSPGSERVYTDLLGQTGVTLGLSGISREQRGFYRAVASNNVASGVESSPAFVDVQFRPEITQDLADQAAGVGGSATFSLERVANPEPTFTWFRNGEVIVGATEGEYTAMNLTLDQDSDTFYVVIANSIGEPVQSRTATLTVNEQATITANPMGATLLEGDPVSFTIEFAGNPTPNIQWQLNGQNIAGANAATYSITSASRTQAGDYTAIVTNTFGSDTSGSATLEVNFAPEFTTNLSNVSANAGQNVTLSVNVVASPAPSYNWFRSTPVSAGDSTSVIPGFEPISGAIANQLVIENVSLEQSGTMYYVEVSNGIGDPVQSATAMLTVIDPPIFTSQPSGATINEGSSHTMTVAVGGTPIPTLQWFFNGNTISGATGTSYTVGSATATSGGTYTVQASNNGNAVTSNEAVVVVNTIPTFITQPSGASLIVGQSFSTSVSATGFQPLTYQWQLNGANVAGATSATFSIPSVTVESAGSYTAIVTNSAGSVTSTAATLEVSRQLRAPTITVPPRNATIATDATVVLTVEATGNPVPAYQWFKSSAAIAGATTPTLSIANASLADAGTYRVRVSNSLGTVTSSPARVTVTDLNEAPVITSQPRNRSAAIETPVTFTVAATGVPVPTYQWKINGVAITGATSTSYTIDSVASSDAGSYSVDVSNSEGSVTSRNALLAVLTSSFEGTYLGSFGSATGQFAITVGPDNTGTFLGFDTATGLYVVGDVVIADDGTFSLTVTSLSPIAPASDGSPNMSRRVIDGGANPPSVALNEVTISGTIGEDGSVGGTVEGVDGLSMAGNEEVGSETEELEGFYESSASGSGSVSYMIIAPNGKVLVFTETPEGADAGVGTVTSAGAVNVTTVANKTVTATVAPTTSTIQTDITDSTGTTTSFSGGNEEVIASQRLVNISSRAIAGSGQARTIAGLVITGEDSKPVLIRAVGPGLAEFGVTGVLAAPRLELFSGNTVIASNTGWSTSADAADITDAAALAGAFALAATSPDSALIQTLAPGAYTALASGADGGSGVVLIEIYDLSSPALGQKLFNISTRADVGSGNQTVVAGFVVSGSVPKRVLLRGVGPTLADYGVNGALADPVLTLFRDTTAVASNDDWGTNAAAVTSASTAAGAFQLVEASKDAAMVISLDPGVYTLHLRGVSGAPGIGLIEVYEIP